MQLSYSQISFQHHVPSICLAVALKFNSPHSNKCERFFCSPQANHREAQFQTNTKKRRKRCRISPTVRTGFSIYSYIRCNVDEDVVVMVCVFFCVCVFVCAYVALHSFKHTIIRNELILDAVTTARINAHRHNTHPPAAKAAAREQWASERSGTWLERTKGPCPCACVRDGAPLSPRRRRCRHAVRWDH